MSDRSSWMALPSADIFGRTAPVQAVSLPRAYAGARSLSALFAATLFLSSSLIFIVEPMFAKMILPLLGGSPAVWNACVVFFQAGLLAGYGYAHFTTTCLSIRQQAAAHCGLVLLAAMALPIALPLGWAPPVDTTPIPWLLLILTVGLGAPFLVVSATAPLLQKWFAGTDHPSARDPYYLYSASNVGSILALLAYPLLVEPSWSLSVQSRTWTLGYGLFAVLTVTCAIVAVRRHAGARPIADDAPSLELSHGADSSRVRWTQRAQWVALSFVPSSLLLGVTTYLSTDIAAVPLMWTVPLTLYLLSFVLAFAPTDMVSPRLVTRSVPLLVAVLVPSMASGLGAAFALFMIPLHLAVLFACALQLHTALARRRPDTRHLTAFYLWVACGGVLGGLFNTLLAPLVFTAVVEYPAALAAACLLRSLADGATDRRLTRADVVVPVAIGLVTIGLAYAWRTAHLQASVFLACLALLTIWSFSFSRRPFRFGLAVAMMLLVTQVNPLDTLHAERTFFGVLRVRAEASSGRHVLMHGSTVHGEQSLDPAQRQEPLTYYHRSGPMGQVIHALTDRPGTARVAVVGLGAGSLAAYATADQHWTFYEIDPAVVRIARDPRLFTYLSGCDACDVVLGDARLSLARAGETAYGLLVLDAFSSDGIPVHLLTREALELYLTKLEPRGVMAFHISNRHLHLRPVLAALAADRGLAARVQTDHPSSEAKAKGHYASEWFLMARAEEALGPLAADVRWERPAVPAGTRVWTDDFSDIVAVLRTSWD